MHRFVASVVLSAGLALPAAAGEVEVIDDEAWFPEGPYWLDGKVYYVEYGGHTIDAWNGAARSVLWREEGCGASTHVCGSLKSTAPLDMGSILRCQKPDSGHQVSGRLDLI